MMKAFLGSFNDHQAKAQELEEDPRVKVSYSNPSANRYVSVRGSVMLF